MTKEELKAIWMKRNNAHTHYYNCSMSNTPTDKDAHFEADFELQRAHKNMMEADDAYHKALREFFS